MFGVRSEADAELTKKTLPMLRELYRRERSRVPVQMKLEIEEGGEKLTVTDADGMSCGGMYHPGGMETKKIIIRIVGVEKLHKTEYSVIPDQIEAGTFMFAAAAAGGDVLVKDVIPKHLEATTAKLVEAGCKVV